jgi:hypothetical protein
MVAGRQCTRKCSSRCRRLSRRSGFKRRGMCLCCSPKLRSCGRMRLHGMQDPCRDCSGRPAANCVKAPVHPDHGWQTVRRKVWRKKPPLPLRPARASAGLLVRDWLSSSKSGRRVATDHQIAACRDPTLYSTHPPPRQFPLSR